MRSSNRIQTTFIAGLAVLGMLSFGCTPEVVNNYTFSVSGDASSNTGSGPVTGSDTSSGTPDTPPSPLLECPEGYIVNSSGDGCAPICAPGYEPNENEDGCVRISQDAVATICPEGYIPAGGGFGGLCAKIIPVTVHGFVSTKGSSDPIAGADVVFFPDVGSAVTTDADGYFSVEVPTNGEVTVQFKADGHFEDKRVITVPLLGGNDGDRIYVDASIELLRDPGGGSVQPPSDGSLVVAGTVYAGEAPASGATVRLFNTALGYDVESATTGTDGSFLFSGISDDGYTFSVRVDPYDSDQNGVYDYQYEEIDLGALSSQDTAGDGGVNVSNIVVVLAPVAKEIAYLNFSPPLTSVGGGALVTNGQFADPNGDIIIHFGAQADTASLDIVLLEYFEGFYGNAIDATLTWNASGTALTMNPAIALTADTNPGTQYEIRIASLLWSDGSPYVVPGSPLNEMTRIRFDIGATDAPPVSPLVDFDIEDLGDDDQSVNEVRCDSRVCWLLDDQGYPYNGPADATNGGSDDTFFNGSSGVDISWEPTPGAAAYRVYVRQTGTEYDDTSLLGWHQVGSDVTPSFAGSTLSLNVADVIATSKPFPNWNDFGVGNLDGPVPNPMAFGNTVEIGVTAINEKGLESLIDPSKVLVLEDQSPARLVQVSPFTGGSDAFASASELGFAGIAKEWRVRLSEVMATETGLSWSVDSAKIEAMGQPAAVSWDDGQTEGPGAPNDEVIQAGITVDFRGPCTQILENAAPEDSQVTVRDTGVFGGATVLFLNSVGTALRFGGVMTVTSVDSVGGVLTLAETFNDVGGTGGVTANDFVCLAQATPGLVATLTQASNGGDQLNVDQPGIFHPNENVLIFNPETLTAEPRTVRRLRAPILQGNIEILPGVIGLDCCLTYPAGALVFPRPSSGEPGFRNARSLDLAATVTVSGPLQVEIVGTSMESSTLLEGDLLIVDVDGKMDTIADRHVVRAGTVNVWPDDGAGNPLYRIQLEAGPGQPVALEDGIELQQGVTRIIHLADSFSISGGADTSGNNGIDPYADQFSFCDSSVPTCSNGIFVY